jgi:lipopolysaccharide export system protein LptA
MFRRPIRPLCILLLGALALPALALDSDRTQPVELSAERAEMNNTTGVSVYTGDVVLIQGTMRITADKMTVYTTAAGDLARVIAEGKNATFRQLPEGQQEYVHARATYMEYQPQAPGHILLQGSAVLTQGKNEFKGEAIRYDMQQDTVSAQSPKYSDKRIRITFFPEKVSAVGAEQKKKSGATD